MLNTLLNAVAADTNGTAVTLINRTGSKEGLFQYAITGTVTLKIQGRVNPNAAWVDVASVVASGAQAVTLYPQMRAVTSGMASGTCTAWLFNW